MAKNTAQSHSEAPPNPPPPPPGSNLNSADTGASSANSASRFVIESGFPVPDASRRKQHEFPFDQMDVGTSFAVPDEVTSSTVSSAANAYVKKKGNEAKKFVVRTSVKKSADGSDVTREVDGKTRRVKETRCYRTA